MIVCFIAIMFLISSMQYVVKKDIGKFRIIHGAMEVNK